MSNDPAVNIKEFFNNQILEYKPYKNNQLFNKLINLILDGHINDAYNIIPNQYKTLFEKQIIPTDVYDNLLISIGLDKNIISKLKYTDKDIILSTMSDFERYKGSVELVKKLSKYMDDELSIGELYLDYDYYDVEDAEKEWMFKTKLLVDNLEDSKNPIFKFDDIYNSIPTFLLSKSELTNLYQQKDIILPIKTNLIFLNITKIQNIQLILQLIKQIFLNNFKETSIKLYIDNSIFEISLKHIEIIWYYILAKAHNVNYDSIYYNSNIDVTNVNYPISEIDTILNEYSNITNTSQFDVFYNQYFNNFNVQNINVKTELTTIEDLENYIATYISVEFITFLNTKISTYEENRKLIGYNDVLTQIYDSLLLFNLQVENIEFKEYFQYFLNSLSFIIFNPKDTISYLLLQNLKPFHSEIITSMGVNIISNDKANITTPIDKYKLLTQLAKVDYLDKSFNDLNFIKLFIEDYSKLHNIIDNYAITSLINHKDNYNQICSDIMEILLKESKRNNVVFKDTLNQVLNTFDIDDFKILDSRRFLTKYKAISDNISDILDNFNTLLYMNKSNIVKFDDIFNIFNGFLENSDVLVFDNYELLSNVNNNDDLYNIIDNIKIKYNSVFETILTINDKSNINLFDSNMSNLKLIDWKKINSNVNKHSNAPIFDNLMFFIQFIKSSILIVSDIVGVTTNINEYLNLNIRDKEVIDLNILYDELYNIVDNIEYLLILINKSTINITDSNIIYNNINELIDLYINDSFSVTGGIQIE